MVKMCECVLGGEEAFRKRPLLSLASSPSSPLTYAEHVCDVLIRSAERGVPFSLVPCPIAGETGPMTLSGSLAQQNAETLGGLVLLQSVDPRLATTYCGRVCIMDPRSGKDLWAVPEQLLASAAMVQIARKYRMVSDISGMTSDIHRWDVQMGLERMMTVLVPFMAGADSISGMGGAWEGASSLEMMVIDNEIWNDIERLSRGFQVDQESLAQDLVDRVGPMGSFLSVPQTMKAIRAGEFRVSPLWDKRVSDKAAREGARTLQESAREKAKQILKEQVPEALDRDVLEGISRIAKEASKELI
jgi:trimethylamine--corrinoid protein Co-methyltransferase